MGSNATVNIGNLYVRNIFNAPLTISAGRIDVRDTKFYKKFTYTKTGNGPEAWQGKNTYNDTLEIFNYSTSGTVRTCYMLSDTANGHIIVSNTSSGGISFGDSEDLKVTRFAPGKTIFIGSGGYTSGALNLYGIIQTDATPISLTLPGNVSVGIGNSYSQCIFNGPVTVVAGRMNVKNAKFNKKFSYKKTGAPSDAWVGKNVFNDTLEIFNNSTSASVQLCYTFSDSIKGDIVVSNTSSGAISFGDPDDVKNVKLASGKSVYIGSGGYATGSFKLFWYYTIRHYTY